MRRRQIPTKRSLRLQLLSHRFLLILSLALALVIFLIFIIPSGSGHLVPHSAAELQKHVQESTKQAKKFFVNPNLPKLYNPFGEKAHQAPEQKDSRIGDTRWYSHWRWMNPLSSAITLDADRAVLPPIQDRTPIYTYYDGSASSDKGKIAENHLILAWRRAWWAQGFEPVVLGKADAQKSGDWYIRLQQAQLKPAVERELERWLAWRHMGGGILSNWLVFPMAKRDDPLLTFLRRGEFNGLTNFDKLHAGFFLGSVTGIDATLNTLFDNDVVYAGDDLLDAIPSRLMKTEARHDALAFYDLTTITSNYGDVAKELLKDKAAGMESLHELINSHLHHTWQNAFPNGIAIIKPIPDKTTMLVGMAVRLGQILRQCPRTPLAASCPPNKSSCKPCDAANLMDMTLPSSYVNDSQAFTIGTVPHPYTFNSLIHERPELEASFIRRDTARDPWIVSTTAQISKKKLLGLQRLIALKETVAAEPGVSDTLWFTAEREEVLEWDWVLGFKLPEHPPRESSIDVQSRLKSGARTADMDDTLARFPDREQLAVERMLFDRALNFLRSNSKQDKVRRQVVEAWNMADMEAWRFVRAFNGRRKLERQQWEHKERAYAGAERPRRWLSA